MPEIKHTFTAGRMNKDLDERLVPNGQYRNALNIQVRTTDGDSNGVGNSGVVQNLEGNRQIGGVDIHNTIGYVDLNVDGQIDQTKIIGSVADESNNSAYFFAAAPMPSNGIEGIQLSSVVDASKDTDGNYSANKGKRFWIDTIFEINIDNSEATPVVVDRYAVTAVTGDIMTAFPSDPSDGYTQITVTDADDYRIGDIIYAQNATSGAHFLFSDEDQTLPGVEIINKSGNNLILSIQQTSDLSTISGIGGVIKFINKERVLEFDYYKDYSFHVDNLVTSINVLDDLLMWSDGNHEPKRINITRCKAGTSSFTGHTQLHVSNNDGDLIAVSQLELTPFLTSNSDLKKENITVIKKKPTSPPNLFLSSTTRENDTTFVLENYNFIQTESNPSVPTEGSLRVINFPSNIEVRINDSFTFTEGANSADPVIIKGIAISINNLEITFRLSIVDTNLTNTNTLWKVTLDQQRPLFETKFGRFAYRYKYEDGECSAFSPWSEMAFLPGAFSYTPNKGFNDGMANKSREIIVRNFIPDDSTRPNDVKTVELLWKTTDNANVYLVKSFTRDLNPEWPQIFNNLSGDFLTGSMTITSEMISRVIASNQLLRSWDNVPKKAQAQEITGSRLLYANYEQGYDVNVPIGINQSLISSSVTSNPKKSIKSLRSYKFGVVYGDKYGRETPVIANGYSIDGVQTTDSNISVEKKLSKFSNKFELQQNWEDISATPLEWMDYVKYYVKETSNEYYNLVMDRWYNAEDGAIWISFPSADRNKVDEETYLILKNEHGSQSSVEEKARYKILDIQSEAPDFIKTDIRRFDKKILPAPNVYDAGQGQTGGQPDLIFNQEIIKVGGGTVVGDEINTADQLGAVNDDFEGVKKIRIIGIHTDADGVVTTGKSPYVTVSRIMNSQEDLDSDTLDGKTGIKLARKYKEPEVNMFEIIKNTYAGTQTGLFSNGNNVANPSNADFIQYHIEMADSVVENKPEFDGRFFAKIEKDDVLKNRVLNEAQGEYITVASYDIAFIEDRAFNNADDSPISGAGANSNFEFNTGDFTEFVADGDGFLSEFGSNNDKTELFWTWFNNNKSTNIFLDGASVSSGFEFLINDVDQVPIIQPDQSEEMASTQTGPVTFGDGGLEGGEIGQIVFSTVGSNFSDGDDTVFKSTMQTLGTQFRFRTDPNKQIYEIIRFDDIDVDNVSIDSKNYTTTDTQDTLANRSSIVIRFRRVNKDTNEINPNGGITPWSWDPRGELQQNGIGSLNLQIVQVRDENELQQDTINTNAACWETEPKENTDLDIYYEASGCIPLFLNNMSDLLQYVGVGNYIENGYSNPKSNTSLFKIVKRTGLAANNSISAISLSGDPYVSSLANKNTITVFFTNNVNANIPMTPETEGVIVGETSITNGVAINDIVSFEHKSGLITKTKILDHRSFSGTTLVGQNISVPSTRASVSSVTVVSSQTGSVFTTPSSLPTLDGASIVGAQITGDNIPNGTFVTNIQVSGANTFKVNTIIDSGTYNITIIKVTGSFLIDKEVYKYSIDLPWFNCYSFGNGVESDRIRDDFNAPQIDNGCRVSATFLEYGQETIGSGMIYSGLYNSTSSVNDLSEFNMAEKITKNINPTYGSIQRLKTRDGDVVILAEDKSLKVMSSGKDAVFNADGKSQLTATDKVLGAVMPFAGDYGISKNPESMAVDGYRIYYADLQRNAIIRLSGNGLTPISDIGMRTYFRENLRKCGNLIGTFDGINDEYNITLDYLGKFSETPTTVSFNEGSKGWVSFKSFTPLTGVSIGDKYLTAKGFRVYEHYVSIQSRNVFYDNQTDFINNGASVPSTVSVVFNANPGSVKSFKAINYEGSQSKVNQFLPQNQDDAAGNTILADDGEYYNLSAKTGWHVESFATDLQEGKVSEFIKKEGKWFNKITGITTTLSNLDASEFSVQGIGFPLVNPTDTQTQQVTTVQTT